MKEQRISVLPPLYFIHWIDEPPFSFHPPPFHIKGAPRVFFVSLRTSVQIEEWLIAGRRFINKVGGSLFSRFCRRDLALRPPLRRRSLCGAEDALFIVTWRWFSISPPITTRHLVIHWKGGGDVRSQFHNWCLNQIFRAGCLFLERVRGEVWDKHDVFSSIFPFFFLYCPRKFCKLCLVYFGFNLVEKWIAWNLWKGCVSRVIF